MNLLDGMKINNTKLNTKESDYYDTSYNSNLDVFTMITRFNSEDEIIRLFSNALNDDVDLVLANLLYILDIRNGKGERRIFKIIYKYLCNNYPEYAIKILPFISNLGRYDYILVGIDTKIEECVINLVKEQLEIDKNSDNPSLLAKWLPSHRTHGKNNLLAKKIIKSLNMSEREYRITLSELRGKLNIVEKNLTNKKYNQIDFSKVPAKAMIKYNASFHKNMAKDLVLYKESVLKGDKKINTSGLFAYEIVKKIILNQECDTEIYDLMWKNQKEIMDNSRNLLVVADTSGSMTWNNYIPFCNSIGLAMYIAERNNGFFRNHFITFSEKPTLQEIKGNNLLEKVRNIRKINAWNTDIDKVFELILNTSIENKLDQNELPEQIIIISDMEFDKGVFSKNGTNFEGWKKAFQESGYKLPTIIFWNVAGKTLGVPVTKFDSDVAMISGFSTNILSNLLNLDKYSPVSVMLETLSQYLDMLDK